MKACFLVVLVFGAALAQGASDVAPKAPKARQVSAYSQAAYVGGAGYPAGAYYQGAPAQAFTNSPYYTSAPASYYPGAYSGASASYYPGAYTGASGSYYSGASGSYYPGSYSGASYPGYSGAPASFYSASPYYSGAAQFAPKKAFKPAYGQSVLPAPVFKGAAPAPAFAAPVFKGAAPAPAFVGPIFKGAAPAPAFAAPVKATYAPAAYATQPNSVIIKQVLDNNFDGSFTSSYETDQGQVVDSRGFVKNAGTKDEIQVIQGSYSYISPEGQPITTFYIADENGFQVQGDHLPQAPEIPEAIAKSLAYQASLPVQPEYVPAASSPAVVLAKKAL